MYKYIDMSSLAINGNFIIFYFIFELIQILNLYYSDLDLNLLLLIIMSFYLFSR